MRGAAGQQFFGAVLFVSEGHAGTDHLLKKSLGQRGQSAEPQWKHQNDMVSRDDGFGRRLEEGRWRSRIEFFLGSQHREFDARNLNAADVVTGLRRSVGIGVGQRMTKMTARVIRVPLNDRNFARQPRHYSRFFKYDSRS